MTPPPPKRRQRGDGRRKSCESVTHHHHHTTRLIQCHRSSKNQQKHCFKKIISSIVRGLSSVTRHAPFQLFRFLPLVRGTQQIPPLPPSPASASASAAFNTAILSTFVVQASKCPASFRLSSPCAAAHVHLPQIKPRLLPLQSPLCPKTPRLNSLLVGARAHARPGIDLIVCHQVTCTIVQTPAVTTTFKWPYGAPSPMPASDMHRHACAIVVFALYADA